MARDLKIPRHELEIGKGRIAYSHNRHHEELLSAEVGDMLHIPFPLRKRICNISSISLRLPLSAFVEIALMSEMDLARFHQWAYFQQMLKDARELKDLEKEAAGSSSFLRKARMKKSGNTSLLASSQVLARI